MQTNITHLTFKLILASLAFLLPSCSKADATATNSTKGSWSGSPARMQLVVDGQSVTVKESALCEHSEIREAGGAMAGAQNLYLEFAFISPSYFPSVARYDLRDNQGKWIAGRLNPRFLCTGYEGSNDEAATRYVAFSVEGVPRLALQGAAELRVVTAGAKELSELNQAVAENHTSEDHADDLARRAWFLATCRYPHLRNGKQALEDALKACELVKTNDATPALASRAFRSLAAAYAETGDFSKASEIETRDVSTPSQDLYGEEKRRKKKYLEEYKNQRPVRE
jgi:hypothetical protein